MWISFSADHEVNRLLTSLYFFTVFVSSFLNIDGVHNYTMSCVSFTLSIIKMLFFRSIKVYYSHT